MTHCNEQLRAVLLPWAKYEPSWHTPTFLDLDAMLATEAQSLTENELFLALEKPYYAADIALLKRFLPEAVRRYVQREARPIASQLYMALLTWQNHWTDVEYDALTAPMLAHWEESLRQRAVKGGLPSVSEFAFLVLWLRETAPILPTLQNMAAQMRSAEAEERQGFWTSFVESLRTDPVGELYDLATSAAVGPQTIPENAERDQRVIDTLRREGILD